MSNRNKALCSKNLRFVISSAFIMGIALLVSGCSTFTRFDFPVFGLDKEEVSETSSIQDDSVRRVYPPLNNSERRQSGKYYDSIYSSESDYRSDRSEITRSELPPSEPDYEQPRYRGESRYPQRDYNDYNSYKEQSSYNSRSFKQQPSNDYDDEEPIKGVVVVKSGDTLYRIAKNNNVSLSDLKRVNRLESNTIDVGQELLLPHGASGRYTDYSAKRVRNVKKTRRFQGNSKRSKSASFIPRSRDSTYRNNNRPKKLPKLQKRTVIQEREISEVRENNYRRSREEGFEKKRQENRIPETKPRPQKLAEKKIEERDIQNSPRVEKITMPQTTGRFRWPVKGRIISKFGAKRNGVRNDGINFSVPHGSEIRAAEGGVVAYAGNELKGYGKLILIRHKGKWVSAYAHNSKLLVRRGQRISRGQVIAHAGKTGSVNQPQLHFELRKGSKPVDPLKYM